jgi:hypothetical protein
MIHAYAKQNKHDQIRPVAHYVGRRKKEIHQGLGFRDNGPEAVAQRKLQAMAGTNGTPVQRTVIKEEAEGSEGYQEGRPLAAQIEVDYSAQVYSDRYGMDIVILNSGNPINPHETLYLVGHQSRPGQFTELQAEALFEVLKRHGMVASTRVVLVGCNTGRTGIFTLLEEFLDHPPTFFEQVLLVSPEGDYEVQYDFAGEFFEEKRKILDRFTGGLVISINEEFVRHRDSFTQIPLEEPGNINIMAQFFQSLVDQGTFKSVGDLTNSDMSRKRGALRTANVKLKNAIKSGSKKNLSKMVHVMRTIGHSDYPPLEEFIQSVFELLERFRDEVAEYQSQYQKMLIERGGKLLPTLMPVMEEVELASPMSFAAMPKREFKPEYPGLEFAF